MKKSNLITIICLFVYVNGNAQDINPAENLVVHDTRDVNDLPSSFKKEIRADMKSLSTIGLNGSGFSTNLTIAPWIDSSAGYNHQIGFTDDEIFYRSGNIASNTWHSWMRILTSDLHGNAEILGRPLNQYEESHVSYCLGNKGLNNGYHKWKMLTASYAGGYGVKSNGYEIWEYPDVLNQNAAKRRFVIQTSRDQNSFSAIIIGPKGGLHIGYPPHSEVADINDLSVNGNVGIGTLDTQGYKLAVNGTVRAKEIRVEINPEWPDYVFAKGYKLPTLDEVKQHIEKEGTLPDVPNKADVKANGVDLGEMNALLLQKIEELTLYILKMQEEVNQLKSNNK